MYPADKLPLNIVPPTGGHLYGRNSIERHHYSAAALKRFTLIGELAFVRISRNHVDQLYQHLFFASAISKICQVLKTCEILLTNCNKLLLRNSQRILKFNRSITDERLPDQRARDCPLINCCKIFIMKIVKEAKAQWQHNG
jgi:hypothetical protein